MNWYSFKRTKTGNVLGYETPPLEESVYIALCPLADVSATSIV